MRVPPSVFAIPPSLGDDERSRLERLAAVFRGRRSTKPVCYHFTPVRCQKFKLLWETGFRASYNVGERAFIHPQSGHAFRLGDALLVAQAMKAAQPAQVEEAPVEVE